ncbi:hypothetical protein [Bacillus mycoides]|uniref:hypothetical protein n=1 Tax=Bacillus mycoides TaxID=1405 RepID=UPI003D1C60E5
MLGFEMPDYLYHYTNLETLKLILQNKTFRLSSLNRMDDLEEGDTADFNKLGRFIYISSWTSNPNDSLLLWSYSRGNDGVRLRMKPDLFKTVHINGVINIHGVNVTANAEYNPRVLELMQNECVSFVPHKAELCRVTYTNLDRLLRPTVYKQCGCGNFGIETQDLGIFKRTEWEDQKEWRYRLSSLPFSMREHVGWFNNNDRESLLKSIRSREDLGYIDLALKDDVFDDLEILCSSKMSQESKKELMDLLNQYAPNATVKDSALKIRV